MGLACIGHLHILLHKMQGASINKRVLLECGRPRHLNIGGGKAPVWEHFWAPVTSPLGTWTRRVRFRVEGLGQALNPSTANAEQVIAGPFMESLGMRHLV